MSCMVNSYWLMRFMQYTLFNFKNGHDVKTRLQILLPFCVLHHLRSSSNLEPSPQNVASEILCGAFRVSTPRLMRRTKCGAITVKIVSRQKTCLNHAFYPKTCVIAYRAFLSSHRTCSFQVMKVHVHSLYCLTTTKGPK